MDAHLIENAMVIMAADTALTLLIVELSLRFSVSEVREDFAKLVIARTVRRNAVDGGRSAPRSSMIRCLRTILGKYGVPFGTASEATNWSVKELVAHCPGMRDWRSDMVHYAYRGLKVAKAIASLVQSDASDSVCVDVSKRLFRWTGQCVLHMALTSYSMEEAHIFTPLFV